MLDLGIGYTGVEGIPGKDGGGWDLSVSDGFEAIDALWDACSHARKNLSGNGSMQVQFRGQFINHSTHAGLN